MRPFPHCVQDIWWATRMIAAAGANDIPVDDVGIFQSSFDGMAPSCGRLGKAPRPAYIFFSPSLLPDGKSIGDDDDDPLLLAALSLSTHALTNIHSNSGKLARLIVPKFEILITGGTIVTVRD